MPRMLVYVKTSVGAAIGVVAMLLGACNNNSGISDQSVSDYVKSQLPPSDAFCRPRSASLKMTSVN